MSNLEWFGIVLAWIGKNIYISACCAIITILGPFMGKFLKQQSNTVVGSVLVCNKENIFRIFCRLLEIPLFFLPVYVLQSSNRMRIYLNTKMSLLEILCILLIVTIVVVSLVYLLFRFVSDKSVLGTLIKLVLIAIIYLEVEVIGAVTMQEELYYWLIGISSAVSYLGIKYVLKHNNIYEKYKLKIIPAQQLFIILKSMVFVLFFICIVIGILPQYDITSNELTSFFSSILLILYLGDVLIQYYITSFDRQEIEVMFENIKIITRKKIVLYNENKMLIKSVSGESYLIDTDELVSIKYTYPLSRFKRNSIVCKLKRNDKEFEIYSFYKSPSKKFIFLSFEKNGRREYELFLLNDIEYIRSIPKKER